MSNTSDPLVLHSSKQVDETMSELPVRSWWSSPNPGLGAMVQLAGGEVGGRLDLIVVSEALARTGIPSEESPPSFNEIEPTGAGWHGFLDQLAQLLAGGDPAADQNAWRTRRARYSAAFGVPMNPAIP